eukprot:3624884-Pleurochrysis_carterae.AAC.1
MVHVGVRPSWCTVHACLCLQFCTFTENSNSVDRAGHASHATSVKNEATIEMADDDTAMPEDEMMMEIRFFVSCRKPIFGRPHPHSS